MFPVRRCQSLLSKIILIVVFVIFSVFFLNGFTKYVHKTNGDYSKLDRVSALTNPDSKLTENHRHAHDAVRRELLYVNSESSKPMSTIETNRPTQENRSSVLDPTKIANRIVSIYVHFDLKGAAPKVSYFEKLFPLLHKWGATGICMEYEDMFPFEGIVSSVKHKQAYSTNEIEQINRLAKENHLEVMPLLQTYGHLEFVLKLQEFSDLRENPKYPQVITPCVNKTYSVLFAMIDQYLNLHPNMRVFHIGHDEVFYFLSHPSCTELKRSAGISNQYDLFAHHLNIIVNYIRRKNPNISLFVWHDVLQNLNADAILKYRFFDTITPVLWSYREDISVEGFVVGPQTVLFGQYKSLWGASAFKGATDEIATISNVQHYYENQVSWIQQLNSYIPTKWKNFDGIILTGWSRFDHFLSLCELLPYALPSMAFSLAAWREPFRSQPRSDLFKNKQLQAFIDKELECSQPIHLHIQEHIAKPVPRCKFPGAGVYASMVSLPSLWSQVEQVEIFVNKFVTDMHVKYNYIHIKRGEECLEKMGPIMSSLSNFIESFRKSMDEVFPPQVAIEWLETYFMRRYRAIKSKYDFIGRAVQEQKSWLPRPIPDIEQLDTDKKD